MQPSYWYQPQIQSGSVTIINYIIHENNRLRAQVSHELNELRTQISQELTGLYEEIAREGQLTRDLITSLFSNHAPTLPSEALMSEAPTVPETVQNKRKSPESSSETTLESGPEPKRNNTTQETSNELSVEPSDEKVSDMDTSNEDYVEEITGRDGHDPECIEEILLDDSDTEQSENETISDSNGSEDSNESSYGSEYTPNSEVKLNLNKSGSFPTADTQSEKPNRFLLVGEACKHLMTSAFISRVCNILEPSQVFRKNVSGGNNGSHRLLLTKSGVSKFVQIAKKRYQRNQDREHREDVFVLLDVIDSWSKEHISEEYIV